VYTEKQKLKNRKDVNTMKKRMLAAVLAVSMLVGLFSGCGGQETGTSQSSAATEEEGSTVSEVSSEGETSDTLFAEPLEFTIMAPIWEPHTKATEDMEIFNAMAEKTNTKITYEWVPQDGYKDRVTTALASGDIPEVISSRDSLSMLISQGAALPLDELLAEYGPNIMASIEDVLPGLKNPADGKLYSVPFVLDYPPAYAMLVRKDWLTAVGIEKIPETWDEWMAAWTAFRDGDPNGDGDNTNDIPYGGDVYSLMPAFGMNINGKEAFMVTDEGEYTLAYESPDFRTYLEAMREMYKEGLLDQEFVTRGTYVNQKEFEKALFAGIVGSGMTWAEIAKRTTESVREINPDAEMVGTKAITGPDGKGALPARGKASPSVVLTVSAEEKGIADEIIQYYNWIFSEEGIRMASYGIEGKHYDMVDGKPVIKEPYCNDFVTARGAGLNFTPLPHCFSSDAYEQILLGGKSVDTLDPITKLYYDALNNGSEYYNAPPVLETEAYMDNQAVIMPKLDTMLSECVTGQITIDEFYTQYEALKPIGLQAILDEGKAAWEEISE
jgi:putative aldouronate transport system substrate-binding protein